MSLNRREFLKLSGAVSKGWMLQGALPGLDESTSYIESRINDKRIVFDNKGVMALDGEPTVPVVMYGLPGDPKEELSWQKAAGLGVNIVTMVYPEREQLEWAEKHKIRLFGKIDYVFNENNVPAYQPTEETQNFSDEQLLERWDRLYKERLVELEKNPSVIGWEVDEPDRYKVGDLPHEKIYKKGLEPMKYLRLFLQWLRQNSKHDLPLRIVAYGGRVGTDRSAFLEGLYEIYQGNVIAGADEYRDEYIFETLRHYGDYWHENPEFNKTVWGVVSAHSNVEETDQFAILRRIVALIVAGSRGVCVYDNPHSQGRDNGYSQSFNGLETALKILEPVKAALLGSSRSYNYENTMFLREFEHEGLKYLFAVDGSGWANNSLIMTCDELTGKNEVIFNDVGLQIIILVRGRRRRGRSGWRSRCRVLGSAGR